MPPIAPVHGHGSPEALASYLRGTARRPFRVGVHDCALFIADWLWLVTGTDPAAALRGRYRTPEEAAALHTWCGLPGTVSRCVRGLGMRLTRTPAIGDVGVVVAGDRLVGAIRTAKGWAMHADYGVLHLSASTRVVAAWSLEGVGRG